MESPASKVTKSRTGYVVAHVKGNPLPPGTVIAIFDRNGVYVGQEHHSHAGGIAHTALYVRQSIEGIEVIHQFKRGGQPQPIQRTFIRFGGGKAIRACSPGWADQGIDDKSGVSGTSTQPEDDADNYYVVELRPHHQSLSSATTTRSGILSRSA